MRRVLALFAASALVFLGCARDGRSAGRGPVSRDPGGVAPDGAMHADARKPVTGWDWNGLVGTGQSLSVGAQASTTTLATQPFKNLKLSLGMAKVSQPPYDANDPALSVMPLTEPIRAEATSYPGAYPLNIYGETPHTAMADQI